MNRTRRQFLAEVGQGMLVAGIGAGVAADLGLARVLAEEKAESLSFGELDPLAGLLQDTPAAKLQPALMEQLQNGVSLRTLVAAAALANARQFGGHDYEGYHTFMALAPAYEMARELPDSHKALPIFKVLYRNTSLAQRNGGRAREILKPIAATELPCCADGYDVLRTAMKKGDLKTADASFATLAKTNIDSAYNDLQHIMQDATDVHRVVLAWRAWDTLHLTGREHAETLLRQSVHFCVESERRMVANKRPEPGVRNVLPKLLSQHKLLGKKLGGQQADDAWVLKLSQVIHSGTSEQAADAVAAALAEGFDAEAVGEAMSLAANQLLLCDGGRPEPVGAKSKYSVHGDSVGVHASDAANAWRSIARVSNPRNVIASLIVGAYHTAGQGSGQRKELYPLPEHMEKVQGKDPEALLLELESAVKARDQALACAVTQRYGDLGGAPRPVFNVLLRFAISEDGALHAEKYYRTATEEFAGARKAFKWRHLIALARVTASEYGQPAPGYAEACRLLKV